MKILGIESTCDETAASIVEDGTNILSNVVSTQTEIHNQYGGVFPEMASRQHAEVILPVIEEALTQAKLTWNQIDAIAVAKNPGLMGSLVVGVHTAKTLAYSLNLPLIGINHIEAHLYSSLMSMDAPPVFPAIGVTLSGGHTHIFKIHSLTEYTLLGKTRDDAIGEAFDKVARLLELPYPGGPHIERLAKKGNPSKFPLKIGQIKGHPLDFSLSGIKTGVLYIARGQDGKSKQCLLSDEEKCDLSASFQRAVFDDVIKKVERATAQHKCASVLFGGGVCANQTLQRECAKQLPHLTHLWPSPQLCMDNGAMIAGLAYHQLSPKTIVHPFALFPSTSLEF